MDDVTQMSVGDMFAGGGGSSIGARMAGARLAWAIEMNPDYAASYARNLGNHVIVSRVEDVDPHTLEAVDILCASPPCQSFSQANVSGVEGPIELSAAESVCRFITVLRPRAVFLENVSGYRRSKSLGLIRDTLNCLGYWTDEAIINSADIGVPQTRKRLILRACRDCMPPPLPSPVRPWKGWLEAVADLLPGLPDSSFAPWQLSRLSGMDWVQDMLVDCVARTDADLTTRRGDESAHTIKATAMRREGNIPRAFIVEGDTAGERCPTVRPGEEPAFTLKAAEGGRVHRAFLVDGYGNTTRDPSLFAVDEPAMTIQAWHGRRPIQTPRVFLVGDQYDKPQQAENRLPTLTQEDEPATTIRAGGASPRAFLCSPVNPSTEWAYAVRDSGDPSPTKVGDGTKHPMRAFVVEGTAAGEDNKFDLPVRQEEEPIFTVRGGNKPRARLDHGRVVSLSPRCLARLQSFPDWYILPDKAKIATAIIGNAVCPRLAEVLIRDLMEAIR